MWTALAVRSAWWASAVAAAGIAVAAVVAGGAVHADEQTVDATRHGHPVYQRHRLTDGPRAGFHRPAVPLRPAPAHPVHVAPRHVPHAGRSHAQLASSAWFQRPYPYHLDYYRMRYGGTYEPYYSGGLYGVPQVLPPPVFGYGGLGYGPAIGPGTDDVQVLPSGP